MEKLSVSKEFVLAAHKAACGTWKEKIEMEFPELFKPKFKDDDWVKVVNPGKTYTTHTRVEYKGTYGKTPEYDTIARVVKKHPCLSPIGFEIDVDGKNYFMDSDGFVLATKEEIEKHLIALAEKKGFKEGVKVVEARKTCNGNLCSGDFCYIDRRDELHAAARDCGGPVIYSKGVWATIIEEPKVVEVTMEEIAKKMGCEVSQLKIKK